MTGPQSCIRAGNTIFRIRALEQVLAQGNNIIAVRVDGRIIATTVSRRISDKAVTLSAHDLPLSVNSFVELEFFDEGDRFLVPARVDVVFEDKLTITYEQCGCTFPVVHGKRSEGR